MDRDDAAVGRGRLIVVDRQTRAVARRYRDALFAYGDNLARTGRGGQAAALRGEPNAVGIPTKHHPTRRPGAYFSDVDLEAVRVEIDAGFTRLVDHLHAGRDAWWPADGIGTGLADLPARAPAIARYIEEWQDSLEDAASSVLPVRTLGRTLAVTLFRPVGPTELARIAEAGSRAFPPRLPPQPIFYPVLEEEYARQIARDWNAAAERTGYRGLVTRFDVRFDYLEPFEIHVVGGAIHREYWIPAEDLDQFNKNILGRIEVIAEYHGSPGSTPVDVLAQDT